MKIVRRVLAVVLGALSMVWAKVLASMQVPTCANVEPLPFDCYSPHFFVGIGVLLWLYFAISMLRGIHSNMRKDPAGSAARNEE